LLIHRNFVNLLNKRIKGRENFVLILEIYNKLIKFEAISFLKQSLIKFIVKSPDELHPHNKESRREFEKAINLLEIINNIIKNQEMIFIRSFLKKRFSLETMFENIDSWISRLGEIENNDSTYDAQDFDELRDYTYIDLTNLYIQIYLTPYYSDITTKELVKNIYKLSRIYLEKLNNFNNSADFDDNRSFRKSEMKFLLCYWRKFFGMFKRMFDFLQDRNLGQR
jgi:hypothetical protein